MSDYRYRNSSDPLYRDPNDPMGYAGYEPAGGRIGTAWGWIAGAIFLVIVAALAFGVRHEPNSRVASYNPTPPAATHPLGPPMVANPAAPDAPGLTPPPAPSRAPMPGRP
jgi:hypothetical protein